MNEKFNNSPKLENKGAQLTVQLQSEDLIIKVLVNSTPTNAARTELHSMITLHHASTRGSRAAKLRIAHLCVPKQLSSTCHVSFFAAPDTDHKHKLCLTCFIHFSYLPDGLTFTTKPHDSQPIYTLRWSTGEWRINTNPISHSL